jgi:dTDP-4-amino-4,6-dideoxygalactose transaminase
VNRKGFVWRCDLSAQYFLYKKEIDKAVISVLKSGVYTLGGQVQSFEREFASYVGRKFGIAVASGTDALILAMKASGIKKGDKVITTVYAPTPVPTAILQAGGIPVFADIDENTCLIDPDEVDRKSSGGRAKYLLPVHLFGSVCDMTLIMEIARGRRLSVIEDVAQAHGSRLGGRNAGTFGDMACFSYYPTKNLGAYGDGGMVLTDSSKTDGILRLLRNYGKKNNPFNSEILGYNSRLDEIQAAILRVKLIHLDQMNRRRSSLVDIYKKGLKGSPITFLKTYEGVRSNHHILAVICGEKRDELARYLARNGIQTNVYYPKPLHRMPAFRDYAGKGMRFPASERVSRKLIALPLYPELPEEKVSYITGRIRKFYS